jgi:excisionase family DNA binding protein
MNTPQAVNYRPRAAKAVPRLLSIKQAIYELGIGRTAIYELIEAGKLRTVKIGRRRLVPIESIEEFVAVLREDGGGHAR